MRSRVSAASKLFRASTKGLSRTVLRPDLPFAIDCFDNIDTSLLSTGNTV